MRQVVSGLLAGGWAKDAYEGQLHLRVVTWLYETCSGKKERGEGMLSHSRIPHGFYTWVAYSFSQSQLDIPDSLFRTCQPIVKHFYLFHRFMTRNSGLLEVVSLWTMELWLRQLLAGN